MKKNPGAAAVLSFLIPGLGQVYNGELGKGIATVIGSVVSWMLTAVFVGFITLFALWIWAIYDAYNTAERINAAAS